MNTANCILAWSVSLLLAACGGSTASNAGGDGGGATGGSCSINAGSYTQHFAAEPGEMNCPPVQDQISTINANETFTESTGSSSADGGQGCTSNLDASTCTLSFNCTITTASDITSTISSTFTFEGNSATGKESIRTTDAMGKEYGNCTYDITMTMK